MSHAAAGAAERILNCPKCSAKLKAPPRATRIKCPRCASVLNVPGSGAAPVAPPATPAPRPHPPAPTPRRVEVSPPVARAPAAPLPPPEQVPTPRPSPVAATKPEPTAKKLVSASLGKKKLPDLSSRKERFVAPPPAPARLQKAIILLALLGIGGGAVACVLAKEQVRPWAEKAGGRARQVLVKYGVWEAPAAPEGEEDAEAAPGNEPETPASEAPAPEGDSLPPPDFE
ncbi:MAG: hypothetical protein HY608_02655 [Planctomycetes bacterium]|nr:hypothetical protein [Planctomycetota bacterium]